MRETTYTIPGCPVSLALVADMHNRPFDDVLSSLASRRPQMIAIAGDMIYGAQPEEEDVLITQSQAYVLPFLFACSKIAPTFFCLGNHEMLLCDEDLDLIRKAGVTLLDNAFITWHPSFQNTSFAASRADDTDSFPEIVIGGLTSGYVLSYRKFKASQDTTERYPGLICSASFRSRIKGRIMHIKNAQNSISAYPPDTAWLSSYAAAPGYHILLSHHPEYLPLIPDSVELVLSGHAHGGQWDYYSFKDHRFHGLYAPGQGIFPKYTGGVYEGRLVVSRGLSNTAGIPRILNPTEIVYIKGAE